MESIFTQAQDELVEGELSIWVKNNPQLKLVSMTLDLVSPVCWDTSYSITELFNGGTVSDNLNDGWLEFLFCSETFPGAYYKTFGLGLYKITAKVDGVNKDHFYIDYRTTDLPPAASGCQIDYALDFNVSAEKFYYRLTQNEFFGYHAFWELRPCCEIITQDLEEYWDNSLAVIPSSDNHPQLVWGPHPLESYLGIYGYRIYRNYGGWDLLATVDDDDYTYVDETLTVTLPGGGAGTDVYYYVKGIYIENPPDPTETDPTNTAVINVKGDKIDKYRAESEVINKTFYLSQNYPNPFNPLTTISFSLVENFYVTLRLFDILGSEVAVLVNETLNAGNHKIHFDGGSFESGVYFYEIKVGNFMDVKKFILLK